MTQNMLSSSSTGTLLLPRMTSAFITRSMPAVAEVPVSREAVSSWSMIFWSIWRLRVAIASECITAFMSPWVAKMLKPVRSKGAWASTRVQVFCVLSIV